MSENYTTKQYCVDKINKIWENELTNWGSSFSYTLDFEYHLDVVDASDRLTLTIIDPSLTTVRLWP